MGAEGHDDAGGIVEDKKAEARERIDQIQKSADGFVDDGAAKGRAFEKKLGDLEDASRDLKQRIDDEKRKHDMPINSSLGNPDVDARNADGRNDLPDDDDA